MRSVSRSNDPEAFDTADQMLHNAILPKGPRASLVRKRILRARDQQWRVKLPTDISG